MKYFFFAVILCGASAAADQPQTITGVVTDTMCGAKHEMKGHSDADCVKLCTKGSSQYALFDGKAVWKLSDQRTPAKFAAQQVKVTGGVDSKNAMIKVVSITAVNTK